MVRGGSCGWASVVVLLLAGCVEARVGDSTAGEQPRAGDGTPVSPERGEVLGGVPVDRAVAWPREEPDLARLAALDAESRRAVESAPLPMLLPDRPWLRDVAVTNGRRWSAVSFVQPGMVLTLQASTRARVYPGIRGVELRDRIRGAPALVTRNEEIVSASWIENGVAYSLELECDAAAREQCLDARALSSAAEGLVYVGGSETR